MYERFTDRSRKVMQMANQEAQRFNHEYIGTEHMLLGLIKENGGAASIILRNVGVDLRRIRLEVEKLVQCGPDMVTMGKLPQTPRAKKVIEYAIEAARFRNDNYVGTEHLLIGLVSEGEGVAYQVLEKLDMLEKIKNELKIVAHFNADEADDLRKLEIEKEQAVRDQDFKKASKIQNQMLDYLNKIDKANKSVEAFRQKEGTEKESRDVLALIAHALIPALLNRAECTETLQEIRRIISDHVV